MVQEKVEGLHILAYKNQRNLAARCNCGRTTIALNGWSIVGGEHCRYCKKEFKNNSKVRTMRMEEHLKGNNAIMGNDPGRIVRSRRGKC